MMKIKYVCTILTVLAMVLAAGEALGSRQFKHTTPNSVGEYEWIADNWGQYGSTGSLPGTDSSSDSRLGGQSYYQHCYINGQDAVCYSLEVGYDSVGVGAALTVNSGSLLVFAPSGAGRLKIVDDAVMNLNGGTVTVNSTDGHGGLTVGYGTDGTLLQSGGLLTGVTNITLSRSSGDSSTYDISGGSVTFLNALNVVHQSASGSQALLKISGTADISGSGDGYSGGIQVYDGGTVQIIGGNATISTAAALDLGGWNDHDGTHTLSFEIDATGASTVNAASFDARAGTAIINILELLANGAAATTYTLIHTNGNPTSDVGNLTVTGDAGFGAPYVVDLTGSTGGYDVRVDYVPEPATLALLAIGGVGLLIRKRR